MIYLGTWHRPGETYDASKVHDKIKYTAEDDKVIDDWIAGWSFFSFLITWLLTDCGVDHVETTWHSLGTCGTFLRPAITQNDVLIFDANSYEAERGRWCG